MSSVNNSKHISNKFHLELASLHTNVITLGKMVQQQLRLALDTLEDKSHQLIDDVVSLDKKINRFQMALDEKCGLAIAHHQPAASDLRFIIAVMRIGTDLERIGDQSKHIARKSTVVPLSVMPESLVNTMSSLMKETISGLAETMSNFAQLDSQCATSVVRHDELIDQYYHQAIAEISEYINNDPRSITASISLMWIAHALERIGDHARNICEAAIYITDGIDVRHSNADEIERALRDNN